MTLDALERAPRQVDAGARTRLPIVDCDIHPIVRRSTDLHPYLSERWRRHLETYGNSHRQAFTEVSPHPKLTPALSRRDAWPPGGGLPGSDLAFMQAQHLDPNDIEHGLLQVLSPNGVNQRNPEFAAAVCGAVNDWQVQEWTQRDARLRAAITIPQEDAAASVVEIERRAGCPDFAQIAMSPRSFNPLGQRQYWPIYEAAVRNDLAIGMHIGGFNGYADTASGHCSYYAEWHQSNALNMQAVVTSLIFEGVFERFPALRMVLVEAGFAWMPSLAWRLDRHWARMRDEVPHVPQPPSHYIRRNIWLTTQPVEEPEQPGHLREVIDWIGWDRLLFSTDYPHWDYDDPRRTFRFRMTEAERTMLFRDNARAVYGLA